MRRWFRIGGLALLIVIVILAIVVTAAICIRPIVGPKVRPLTDLRFEPSPQQLERGRHLATAVNGCVFCHSELGWSSPGFPVVPGTEGGGRSWKDEGLPFITSPNITPTRHGRG
jgi:hypothetical protein